MGAGVVVALFVASIVGLYFIGEHSIADQRAICSGSENFVATRSKLKMMQDDGSIDGPVVEREDAVIQKALDLCALGEKGKSGALLMSALMDAALQSDEVYARKINGASSTEENLSVHKIGSPQGDPSHPKENPFPVKRYELIAQTKAPGRWDSVTGKLTFVVNSECVPKGFHSRGWLVPNVAYTFEMKRYDENTWKGYFFRDVLQDENYFGLGVCHWDAAHVTASFVVNGIAFNELALLYFDGDATHDVRKDYFLKSSFLQVHPESGEAMGFSHYNSDTSEYPERYFTISAQVQEASH